MAPNMACEIAWPVVLSRKRTDNDGPKSAGQSANFQMAQSVRTIRVARTVYAIVARLAARPLNLATGDWTT
jgi:hypothetical protein